VAKFVKNSFRLIDQSTEPLRLIHSDLYDLKFEPISVGKSILVLLLMELKKPDGEQGG